MHRNSVLRRPLMLVAVLSLVLAACSSSDGTAGIASLNDEATATVADSAPTGGTATAESDEEALLAFTQCMRDKGVDIGDPIVDADGNLSLGGIEQEVVVEGDADADPDELFAEMDAVFEECGEHLDGVSLGFEQQDATEFEDTLLAFTQCMRDNGIDMDDPDLSGGGGLILEIDPNDSDFQVAREACEDLLNVFGPGIGGPPGDSDNV